jgi:hypothetical protein
MRRGKERRREEERDVNRKMLTRRERIRNGYMIHRLRYEIFLR